MNAPTRPPAGIFDSRLLLRWPFPFAATFTWGVALLLLVASGMAILEFRSQKYLVALIVAAVGAAALLVIPHKQYFLVLALGFSLPYHVKLVLVERDVLLAITGTFLLALSLGLVCLANGHVRKKGIMLVPAISVPTLFLMTAGFMSFVNTTDKTDTLIALAQDTEMFLLFLVLVNAIRDEMYLMAFLRGLFLGFAVQCGIYVIQNILGISFEVVGNAQYVGSTDLSAGRIVSHEGTLGGAPATAALYFSILTILLMGAYLCRGRLAIRLNPVLGMAMGAGCLLLSAKRAPLAGFLMGMALMGLLIVRHSALSIKRLFRILAVVAIPFLIFLPVLFLRLEANHEEAYDERMNLTQVAWNMFDAHPLFGVGLGTYDGVMTHYLPEDWAGWLYKVHNGYLIILAETGIVGMSAFALLFVMILLTTYRGFQVIDPIYRPMQIALLSCLVAILWEYLWDVFDNRTQEYITWFLVALSVILPRVLAKTAPSEMLLSRESELRA